MILRLAIFPDFPEENWPSMDLCSQMLLSHLPAEVAATHVCPKFVRLANRLPILGQRKVAFNADRLFNRFAVFPLYARRVSRRFDAFHIVDHTYAQLVHSLPAERTGVYCHDLDAFRCLIESARDPRPRWFRCLARRILTGMQKAAVVFHSTGSVKEELVNFGLVDPTKLVHAPYGAAPEFTQDSPDPAPKLPWLDALTETPWVLHVGSCIPRKRIDVLLDVVAAARSTLPNLRLVKIGGEWTASQRDQISRLGLSQAIVHVCGLNRLELAEVYRRAPVVLVPSESEGFGLPVIEALACGSPVVASDIPVLHEVGGPACSYAKVGDMEAWTAKVLCAFRDHFSTDVDSKRLEWSRTYSWDNHAALIARTYRTLMS